VRVGTVNMNVEEGRGQGIGRAVKRALLDANDPAALHRHYGIVNMPGVGN
jgi:hypothetical protein